MKHSRRGTDRRSLVTNGVNMPPTRITRTKGRDRDHKATQERHKTRAGCGLHDRSCVHIVVTFFFFQSSPFRLCLVGGVTRPPPPLAWMLVHTTISILS